MRQDSTAVVLRNQHVLRKGAPTRSKPPARILSRRASRAQDSGYCRNTSGLALADCAPSCRLRTRDQSRRRILRESSAPTASIQNRGSRLRPEQTPMARYWRTSPLPILVRCARVSVRDDLAKAFCHEGAQCQAWCEESSASGPHPGQPRVV